MRFESLNHFFASVAVALIAAGTANADDARSQSRQTDSHPPIANSDIARLEVFPPTVHLRGRDSQQQLLVTAIVKDRLFAAGLKRDVTDAATFQTEDPKVAVVATSGRVTPIGNGATTITVTAGGHRKTVTVRIDDGNRFLPIDFTNDITPVFTRLGCNSGGCHGKTTGRGGFRLSLFGFTPRLDYESITREERGRRVFPGAAERSLLLHKPLNVVPHGGGRRLDSRQPEYARLRRWIAGNMPWGTSNAPRVKRLELFPASRVMRFGQRQRIAATAIYSDGSRRDVTRLVELRAHDPAIADVDEQSGIISTKNRVGETAIVAQFQGQAAICTVTVPVTDPNAPRPILKVRNSIDRHVLEKLTSLRIPPSDLASDSVFLRRASIQLAGRLPTLAETRAFLADEAPDKYDRLVDRHIASNGFADVMAQKWSALLRNKRRGQKTRIPGTKAFHGWIRDAFRKNMPFDRFVRGVLTATESVKENPPAQWYAEVRYLDRYVDDTAQVFLGIRIGCARCHHHPFEVFSQDDYFGLAAFFGRVGRTKGTGGLERAANESIYVKSTGTVTHPVSGKVVQPRGLGGPPLDIPPCDDPRGRLVDWMTEPGNPYFARAFANRMWAHFFGRGLIEPRDDMRATNPASNSKLLDALARKFVEHKFDVKHLARVICQSETYRVGSLPNRYNLEDSVANSRFLPQRIPAEILLDNIDAVTKVATSYKGLPAGTRAIQLPDEDYSNAFLKMYGRPDRMSACECERESKPTLRQSMFLMNDPFILKKIESKTGYAAKLAGDKRPMNQRVEELFLTALTRLPTSAERERALDYLRTEKDDKAAFADLLWALIHTKEFMYVR